MAPRAALVWRRELSVWSVVFCGAMIARESKITFAVNVISVVMSALSARVRATRISIIKSHFPHIFIA